jgi:hypothetical protein
MAVKSNTVRAKPPSSASLTRKKFAFRLPLDLAAQFEALCELNPETRRARVMADLLRLGLAQVTQDQASFVPPQVAQRPDHPRAVYLPTGPFAEFHGLVHKHHLALERELRMEEEGSAPQALDEFGLGDTA